jgi:hypothetical protein
LRNSNTTSLEELVTEGGAQVVTRYIESIAGGATGWSCALSVAMNRFVGRAKAQLAYDAGARCLHYPEGLAALNKSLFTGLALVVVAWCSHAGDIQISWLALWSRRSFPPALA